MSLLLLFGGAGASTPLTVDVALLEGATVKASWTNVAVTSSFVDLALTITSAERASIGNFANLRVRITATGDSEQVYISEIPGLTMFSEPVALTVDVALLEGATVRASWTNVTVTSSFVDLPLTITSGERASIGNFANLRVQITATGTSERVRVSEILGLEMTQVVAVLRRIFLIT